MPLETGQRLGHYEIVSPLGAGGMGEVYRARDTKLGREVAIKLLLEEVSADPDRLARFEREARVLASLNHVHIATLHGLEQDGDRGFLVMELVEGDTLADRIARGPIPAREAVPIFIAIAEGLDAAHEKGVVHRDLKPANIKLGEDGDPLKILDFGLAKAVAPERPDGQVDESASMSPTLTLAATQRGEVMGTAAYMSPEQAKGRAIDRRTDVWAFGACLMEALSGRRAFKGEDASELMGAVLMLEPQWEALPGDTPQRLRELIGRCLQKDRRQRLRDIGDALFELEQIRDTPPGPEPATGASDAGRRPSVAWIAAALLAGAAIASLVAWSLRSDTAPQAGPVIRSVLTGKDSRPMAFEGFLSSFALSPNGRLIAYRTDDGLYLRPVDDLASHKVADVDTHTPFFSPDSEWLGYANQAGAILKVSVRGGPAVTLCEDCGPIGATWADDGFIYFNAGNNVVDLARLPSDRGPPEAIAIVAPAGIGDLRWPRLLPRGTAALVTLHQGGLGAGDTRIALLDLATGELSELIERGGQAVYASTGHIVYGVDGTLMAAPFDAAQRALVGSPVPLFDGLVTSRLSGAASFDIAANGSLAFAAGTANSLPATRCFWNDRDGGRTELPLAAGMWLAPSISPDGSLVALSNGGEQADIWIWEVARQAATRFTFAPGIDTSPIFSPDGTTIYWAGNRAGSWDIYSRSAAGTGDETLELADDNNLFPTSISPDGALLVFNDLAAGFYWDVGVLDLRDGSRRNLINSEFRERDGAISPDGRWIAYTSDESGQYEVFVRPFPDVDSGRWQVSSGGGTQPRWGRDRDLYYGAPQQGQIVRAAIAAGTAFRVESVETLVSFKELGRGFGRGWDLHPDGRALIVESSAADVPAPEIVLVQNFLSELERRVPRN